MNSLNGCRIQSAENVNKTDEHRCVYYDKVNAMDKENCHFICGRWRAICDNYGNYD